MCNCKLLVVFILACLHVHTFAYSADVRYEIQNFDTSNEAGQHKPTYGAICIARKTYWTGALSVTALGGNTAFPRRAALEEFISGGNVE